MDVRQHFRINKGVTSIFVTCNSFKTTLGQNIKTEIDEGDFVAKGSVTGRCTETLDKNFGEATLTI